MKNPKFVDAPVAFRIVHWRGQEVDSVVLTSDPQRTIGSGPAATLEHEGLIASSYVADPVYASATGITGCTIDNRPHVCQRCGCNMTVATRFFCSIQCQFDMRCEQCGDSSFGVPGADGQPACPECLRIERELIRLTDQPQSTIVAELMGAAPVAALGSGN